MTSCFTYLFKKIETINKKKTHTLECQSALPVIIFKKNGKPLSIVGFSRGSCFESHFFTVLSINKETQCAVLEVLLCKPGKLFRTEACVTVDISCICGIEIVSIPVFDCFLEAHMTNDHFCLPFTLAKADTPKIIWSSTNQHKIKNVATISVNYEGTDPEMKLIINTKEKAIPLAVLKGQMSSITALNLLSIEVSTPNEQVKGTVEIQLNLCEKKIVHL
ncbi:CotZ-related putative spore coat protein [Bacillus sp. FJAT-52991]|uniref:CotZ-related putative spore coat protein n=1 Tax=Bacillus kandeliae TaxID=3129297 RepID=A0ABZ2NBN0_9BACI